MNGLKTNTFDFFVIKIQCSIVLFVFCLLSFSKEITPPNWLKNKPTSTEYYIGIAKVNKSDYPLDYSQVALNMALSFLSSEIKIFVKSKTTLILGDYNNKINNLYREETKTKVDENLEGYEIVDTWENKKQYAVYCHLSKVVYLESKRKAFLGTLNLISKKYEVFKAHYEANNFQNCLRVAAEMHRDSKNMLRREYLLPYMKEEEIELFFETYNAKENMLEDLKVEVISESIFPFKRINPDELTMRLLNAENNGWVNWRGKLYNHSAYEMGLVESNAEIGSIFPLSIYVGTSGNLSYTLHLIDDKDETKIIKKIPFRLEPNASVVLGEIYLRKSNKELLTDVKALCTLMLNPFEDETLPKQRIDVEVDFDSKFKSAGFVAGNLILEFINKDTIPKDTDVAIVLEKTKGTSQRDAITKGIQSLRNKLNNNETINFN